MSKTAAEANMLPDRL